MVRCSINDFLILQHDDLGRLVGYFQFLGDEVGDRPEGEQIQVMETGLVSDQAVAILESLFGKGADTAGGTVFENDLGSLRRAFEQGIEILLFRHVDPFIHGRKFTLF